VTLFDANQSPLKLGLFTIANVISWGFIKAITMEKLVLFVGFTTSMG
jgi:hypothetical protein